MGTGPSYDDGGEHGCTEGEGKRGQNMLEMATIVDQSFVSQNCMYYLGEYWIVNGKTATL